ncbi:hypothetical protein MXB_1049 [Myxobolus squamalis]|nr:hypothetical protein MXB_1049 [Myxobolus squamalis]
MYIFQLYALTDKLFDRCRVAFQKQVAHCTCFIVWFNFKIRQSFLAFKEKEVNNIILSFNIAHSYTEPCETPSKTRFEFILNLQDGDSIKFCDSFFCLSNLVLMIAIFCG